MDDRSYAMLAKPVSSACNLRCEYCYYLEKNSFLNVSCGKMPREILEAFIIQNLEMHGADAVVEFAWHGGEPLLAGIDFFREATELQKKYGNGRKIRNTLQTNATLITDEICDFFKENDFLIGVSIDGPEHLHNKFLKTSDGKGSFEKTMEGIRLLKKHDVPFNTLTALNRENADHPVEVYSFLRELTDYMQFLPVVESEATEYELSEGQHFAAPPGIHSMKIRHPVRSFSILPEQYGYFLVAVLKEWIRLDRGTKHVQIIDAAMSLMETGHSPLCVHDPLCGHSGSVEANGDVYSCDRYAFPEYRLGNILEQPLADLMEKNRKFGMHKTYGLDEDCFECPYLKLCFGGCPKDRLFGKNYLCEGYKIFFEHLNRG